MLNKDLGVFDFDLKEKSDLEIFVKKLKPSNEKNKNFDCIGVSDNTKKYIYDLISNHKYYIAQREIYENLGELEKNGGLDSFKNYFIEYLASGLNIEKENSKIWNENSISFFIHNLGIQFIVDYDNDDNEEKIIKNREKINNGINFTYDYKDEDTGNEYRICIPNREVPSNIALLQFNSDIINTTVNGYKSVFVNHLFELDQKDFLRLYNELEIIKNSFPIIIEKINYIKKNKFESSKKFIQGKETDLNYDLELSNDFNEAINKWIEGEMKDEDFPGKYTFEESNINYIYNTGGDSITFKVYYQNKKSNKNDNTLIYQFTHYFCEKNIYNNSHVPRELIFENIPDEQIELNKNQIINKKISINKDLKELLSFSNELKARTKKLSINRKKIEKNFSSSLVNKIKDLNEFLLLKKYFLELQNNKEKKEEFKLCLLNLEGNNSIIIEQKKLISWLVVFINNLRDFLIGNKEPFNELGSGLVTDEERLINDPYIAENNFYKEALYLKKAYKELDNLLKYILLEDSEKYNAIIDTINKLFNIRNKVRRGKQSYIDFLYKIVEKKNTKLQEKKEELKKLDLKSNGYNSRNIYKKANLKEDKNKIKDNSKELSAIQSEIDKLDNYIKKIYIFIEKFINFKNDIIGFKKKISKFNSTKLLRTSIDENNFIYGKEFLSNVMNGVILKNKKLNKKNIKKEEIHKNLLKIFSKQDDFDILDFSRELERHSSNDDESIFINDKLLYFLGKLELKLELLEKDLLKYSEPLENKHSEYFNKISELNKILSNFFNDKVIKSYKISISDFIANFAEDNSKSFNYSLVSLILKIGLENNFEFNNLREKLDTFELYHEEIMNFQIPNYDLDLVATSKGFDEKAENISYLKEDLRFKYDMIKVIDKNLK